MCVLLLLMFACFCMMKHHMCSEGPEQPLYYYLQCAHQDICLRLTADNTVENKVIMTLLWSSEVFREASIQAVMDLQPDWCKLLLETAQIPEGTIESVSLQLQSTTTLLL